jgi:2-polyprenyl-6-methoxyphenol hydroxylase-like FAD-dependent oxidoreductase
MSTKVRNVLISGAGIAGPTLAYWLLRRGFTPTIVEEAPSPRAGGYVIDFWGLGWEVAERMGLTPVLLRDGYRMKELRLVNSSDQPVARLDVDVFRAAVEDRFISIHRGDLARGIYSLIDGKVETIFGDSIAAIQQDPDGVDVSFEHSAPRRFDMVVGADGLHSNVRKRVFGDERRFERYLGYYAASFNSPNYPVRDQGVYVSYALPGRQLGRYALRDGRTTFFFTFIGPPHPYQERMDNPGQKAALRQAFGGAGWECPAILDAMESSNDLFFDAVSQVRMDRWSHGRVGLLGDACSCPSLLAGQGSALAMAGAYVLAAELEAAGGDYAIAFENYQQRFKPFMDGKQEGAVRSAGWFAPRTRLSVQVRNLATRFMNMPLISTWMVKRMFADQFDLSALSG